MTQNRNWFQQHKILTAVLAIILIAFIADAAGTASDSSTEKTSSSEDPTATQDSDNNAATETFSPQDAPTTKPKSKAKPKSDPDDGTVGIIVKSTGSRSASSITYVRPGTSSYQMSQADNASLPWVRRFKTNDELPLGWNMNAQQSGSGRLTCIVKQDGDVIAKNSSTGTYAVVGCQP